MSPNDVSRRLGPYPSSSWLPQSWHARLVVVDEPIKYMLAKKRNKTVKSIPRRWCVKSK